jgi:catechol 2,3-dioxygenase-like lactoylglutathione lyase family enzyme
MNEVSVRYFVRDMDAAVDFYCRLLGFEEELRPSPAFAMLYRGSLRLLLSVPGAAGGGGSAMPDGAVPEPGGWNRFTLEVPDLAAEVGRLRQGGASFRNDIVTGVGVKQILAQDPDGNPVELFERLPAYHERPAATSPG